MASPTQYYCDCTVASDGGDGSVGSPWTRASANALQYAIDNVSSDATDGVQINVKSGTPHGSAALAAILNLTSCSHTPAASAPLIIRGYDSAENDGGIGEIHCGTSYTVFNQTEDYVQLADLEVYTGANGIQLDNTCVIDNCYVHDMSGNGIRTDSTSIITDCIVQNVGAIALQAYGACAVRNNFILDGVNTFTYGIYILDGTTAERNIIYSTDGHGILSQWSAASFNTIYLSGGANAALGISNGSVFENNLLVGGGTGSAINYNSAATNRIIIRNNYAYNFGTTELNKVSGEQLVDSGNSLSLASDPLAKSGANTFANRFIYYAPQNDAVGAAHPTGIGLDVGAVQSASGGGGGLLRRLAKVTGA